MYFSKIRNIKNFKGNVKAQLKKSKCVWNINFIEEDVLKISVGMSSAALAGHGHMVYLLPQKFGM